MKAVEILLNEIDKLNSKIKLEEDIDKKVLLAFEIEQVIKIIGEIQVLKSSEYLGDKGYMMYLTFDKEYI